MTAVAIAGARSKKVRLTATSIVGGLDQKEFLGEIALIGGYVRDNIRYVRDIAGCETIQTPELTLDTACGDCDDKATLSAALLMAIGNTCRFVAANQGRGFCHVWTQVLFNGKWLDIETTEPVLIGQTSRYLRKGDRLLYWPIDANAEI